MQSNCTIDGPDEAVNPGFLVPGGRSLALAHSRAQRNCGRGVQMLACPQDCSNTVGIFAHVMHGMRNMRILVVAYVARLYA